MRRIITVVVVALVMAAMMLAMAMPALAKLNCDESGSTLHCMVGSGSGGGGVGGGGHCESNSLGDPEGTCVGGHPRP
jgi:hypothetical protein